MMTLILPEPDYVALAHVNWGSWIARCPRPGCSNAEHYGPHPLSGHVGGLTTVGFRCNHCTLECPAKWPSEADREVIERVLGMRPIPANRNWQPGESIRDLLAENVMHGLMNPPEVVSR